MRSLSSFKPSKCVWHIWSEVLVGKGGGQLHVGFALGEQRVRLGLERLHGVGAGSKAGRRLLECDELDEGVGELANGGSSRYQYPLHTSTFAKAPQW